MKTDFFGMVDLSLIENSWLNDVVQKKTIEEDKLLGDQHVKIVHYPDCQQMIIWLPSVGALYDAIAISEAKTGKEVWRKGIHEIISGSIQLVLDTLPLKPGKYTIQINKKDGLQHLLHIKKYKEGELPSVKTVIEVPSEEDENKPSIVYKDGFGNVIIYGDLDPNMDRLR
jgi:hypothetical protein